MSRPLCEWCGEYTALVGEKRCILCRRPTLETEASTRRQRRLDDARRAFDEASASHQPSTWRRGRGPGSLPGYG